MEAIVPFQTPTSNRWEFCRSIALGTLRLSLSFGSAVLVGGKCCFTMVLACISWWLMTVDSLSYTYWPFVYLLWNVFSFLSTFFFLLTDYFLNLLIYLFMAVLGLRFCARAFSSCGKRRPLFIAVRGPLTVTASLVAEHRLQTRKLSSCGTQA